MEAIEQHAAHFTTLDSLLSSVKEVLKQDDVSDVMVNADGKVWYESSADGLCCLDAGILDPVKREAAIHIIASICGQDISAEKPSLACKLAGMGWNARVQANIPPVVSQSVISFRRPSQQSFNISELQAQGVISTDNAKLLTDAIMQRKNIVVGGGTGSGKTTLSNALLVNIPTHDRLYIIEDTPELQVPQPNYVQILTNHHYTMRHAVVDAMRHRPDRIIVGEIRDGAALELLKSWNTGHPGGIATVHANSASAVHSRLHQLVQESVVTVPKNLVEESVQIVVFMKREGGKRFVEDIYTEN